MSNIFQFQLFICEHLQLFSVFCFHCWDKLINRLLINVLIQQGKWDIKSLYVRQAGVKGLSLSAAETNKGLCSSERIYDCLVTEIRRRTNRKRASSSSSLLSLHIFSGLPDSVLKTRSEREHICFGPRSHYHPFSLLPLSALSLLQTWRIISPPLQHWHEASYK